MKDKLTGTVGWMRFAISVMIDVCGGVQRVPEVQVQCSQCVWLMSRVWPELYVRDSIGVSGVKMGLGRSG